VVKYTSFYKVKTEDKKEDKVLFTSFLTENSFQTKKIGQSFAKDILKLHLAKRAVVFGLRGDLGGGKTTFLQGFARGLGIKEKILSPTFIVMRRLEINNPHFNNFYHLDCYRIKRLKEISDLGLKEIMSDAKNIVAIEWAGIIKKILPKDCVMLEFEFMGKNKRKITMKQNYHGE